MVYWIKRITDVHDHKNWHCDICDMKNKLIINKCKHCKKQHIFITIKLFEYYDNIDDVFRISICYSSTITIKYLLNKIMIIFNKKYNSKRYYLGRIEEESFIEQEIYASNTKQWKDFCSTPLTNYSLSKIKKKGIIAIIYKNKTKSKKIQ